MIILVFIITVVALIWLVSKSFNVGAQAATNVIMQQSPNLQLSSEKNRLVNDITKIINNTKPQSFTAMRETQLLLLEFSNYFYGIDGDLFKNIIATSYISIDKEIIKSYLNVCKTTYVPYDRFVDYIYQLARFSYATGVQKNNVYLTNYSSELLKKLEENLCLEDWDVK